MVEAEKRHIDYLFKLRQTPGVQQLIEGLFWQQQWQAAGSGWEGTESMLQLSWAVRWHLILSLALAVFLKGKPLGLPPKLLPLPS
ncbi:MAG: hypothetical protein WCQ99_04935 [Pseudomonadota bacterium]